MSLVSGLVSDFEALAWKQDLQTASEMELDIELTLLDIKFQGMLANTWNPFKRFKYKRAVKTSLKELKRLVIVHEQHVIRMRESL